MRIFRAVSLVVLLLASCVGRADDDKRPADIQPRFRECTLSLGKDTIKASRETGRWYPEHYVGRRRICVRDDTVSVEDAGTGNATWSTKAPDGRRLVWLAADHDVVYLTATAAKDGEKKTRPQSPPVIRRLDLTNGKWLTALSLPKAVEQRTDVIDSLVVFGDTVAALSLSLQKGSDVPGEDEVHSYRVTRFGRDDDKLTWTQSFPSAGDRPYTGGALLAASRPEYAWSDLRTLSRLGDKLLVCAGPRQDLICLDTVTGNVSWRQPRIWEFARGFTGPSVWSHHISRFGLDFEVDWLANDTKKGDGGRRAEERRTARDLVASNRKEFDKRFDCSIIGGPVVVQGADEFTGRIFVAVARGPADSWAGYLSDCLVYELDGAGKPCGIATLPRLALGRFSKEMNNGIVWACQHGAMTRLRVSDHARGFVLMGPGSPDLITPVDWYRQFRVSRPAAWLTADKALNAVAFTSRHAILAAEGGYVLREDETAYHFPLTVVDLKTGLDRPAVLTVPLAGRVPPPGTNMSREDNRFSTWGPYLLGVTALETHGTMLRVCLGMEGGGTGVEFDLGRLKELNALGSP